MVTDAQCTTSYTASEPIAVFCRDVDPHGASATICDGSNRGSRETVCHYISSGVCQKNIDPREHPFITCGTFVSEFKLDYFSFKLLSRTLWITSFLYFYTFRNCDIFSATPLLQCSLHDNMKHRTAFIVWFRNTECNSMFHATQRWQSLHTIYEKHFHYWYRLEVVGPQYVHWIDTTGFW